MGLLLTLWHMKWELLISFSPFLMMLVAFLLFVCWNRSVLGAKESHAVTPHFAQILYFSLVSVLALPPVHLLSHKLWTYSRCFVRVGPFSFRCSWPLLLAFSQYTFSVWHIHTCLPIIDITPFICGGRLSRLTGQLNILGSRFIYVHGF